jgi:hypothetical protein
MIDQKWSTYRIRKILDSYSRKGKIFEQDYREMFLLFAMRRKLKLMNYMIHTDAFVFEFEEINFVDVLENNALDMGVLLYREYFLKIKTQQEMICTLLLNSFARVSGQLESKHFLFKRFIPNLKFEQAMKFLEVLEKGISDSSRGNILVQTLNVVKSSCMLIELLEKVRGQFSLINRRCKEIRN